MLEYCKLILRTFWEDFSKATGEQVIGILLAIGILLFQLHYGLIKLGDMRANLWAIVSPYVVLLVCFLFWHLIRAPWKLHQQNIQAHEETKASLLGEVRHSQEVSSQAETRIQHLLNLKPNLNCRFDYGGQQASLWVTNSGAIAEVWASLRIEGSVSGRASDIFARWTHTNDSNVSIAKGQTCRLILALSRRDSRTGQLMADWEIPYASHTGYEETHSTHASIVGRADAQAPDIHLYVGIFSNPDCEQVNRERHIVLHALSAEELSN